ncbi:hypothetical protein [Glycomyces paridis]|uniref:Uncharacterized protein n=1 Tax=Glycomyces paridis TaxID=2126555 RepID=A0A4S8PKR4_9ACTN|nr:hypothetical protein [Glycomyces paridis]THV31347.1 hypothetical protein E9998_02975 [Glycomyces paridis]
MPQYRSKSKGDKPDSGLELSVGQVLAAAGATVIGAVLAKLLNLWGTVAGTAILSVCSSIGAVLILRAMRSTGDRIKSQIAAMSPTARGDAAVTVEVDAERTVVLGPDGTPAAASETVVVTATAEVPETEILPAAGATGDTVEMDVPDLEPEGHVTKVQSRKRTLLAVLVSSVLVFSLTITVLFLIGALTGDGTRFIHDGGDTQTTVIVQTPDETATEPSETATETPSETASPEATASEDPGGGTGETATEEPGETATTPSQTPSTEQGATDPTPSTSPEAAEEEALTEAPTTEE